MPNPNPESKIEDRKWQERIDHKCAAVILRAIASFPKLLDECEAEAAAAIVADLIKSQVNRPVAPEPTESLGDIITRAYQQADEQAARRDAGEPDADAHPALPFARDW
jgi:hypothetical protein